MSKLNNIINNLMDIIISLVRIGVEYLKEFILSVVKIIYSDNTIQRKEENMWNGGETNKHQHANGYVVKDITDTPYDESNVIYDGVYDD